MINALSNRARGLLTGDQAADFTQPQPLLNGLKTNAISTDKNYDADALISSIHDNDATRATPPKRIRLAQRDYDRHLYKDRNLAERFLSNQAIPANRNTQ